MQLKIFQLYINFATVALINFFLLLRKGVYPYEDMDSWRNFGGTAISPKEAFYSELNEEGISDADYAHVQKVWEVFKTKNNGEYHDLYVQCDTLLPVDVFENFRDRCIKIYGLDPALHQD